MSIDLPVVFTVLMGVAILAYVILDGYDLGVGILLPFASSREQNVMVSSIGPFWDANETWLVLGIGLLLVAFPAAHGEVLTALYMPVLIMLVGLILRGVAFEMRVKAEGWHRDLWNWFFWAGSVLAALAQGVMLGLYICGFAHGIGYYIFALVVALGVVGGYVLLGATWLIVRASGELQKKALRWTHFGLIGLGVALVLVTSGTMLESETIREKWLEFPAFLAIMLIPAALVIALGWVWHAAARIDEGLPESEWTPFIGTVSIYVIAFLGLVYSIYPYIIIDRMTIWEAAAHPSSLTIVLIGALIVLPMIVIYSGYAYYVFRGKAREKLYE